VVLDTDPTSAREKARSHTKTYTGLPNYKGNIQRLDPTFTDEDFADAGSDRLVDHIVAWGSMDDAVARVQAHLDAGADHVCIQVIDGTSDVPLQAWRDLSSAFSLA